MVKLVVNAPLLTLHLPAGTSLRSTLLSPEALTEPHRTFKPVPPERVTLTALKSGTSLVAAGSGVGCGDSTGCVSVGVGVSVRLVGGVGTTVDLEKARYWFQESASQEFDPARHALSRLKK